MNTLDIAQNIFHLNPKWVAATKKGEYASACPICGGNDRFRIWPKNGKNGTCYCRGCDKHWDAIQLLIDAKGMTFKEACDLFGRELTGKGARPRGSTPRAPRTEAPDFIPREITDPAELWQARAAAFARSAHRELLGNKDQLAWLAERGITVETVKRFRLGWNPKSLFRKRTTWGLPEDTIKVKKDSGDPDTPPEVVEKKRVWLWLPTGLVIPYFLTSPLSKGGEGGGIHRIRIRRPEEGLDDRYYVVPGSGMAPLVIARVSRGTERNKGETARQSQPLTSSPSTGEDRGEGEISARAWSVVESELDAVLIAQDAGDLVGVVALGSVSIKPDGELHRWLKASDVILSALDYDRAGAKAKQWWLRTYPQADRWPTPSGKDPGDYRKEGGDVRAWIIAGLPYGLRPVSEPSPFPKGGERGITATPSPSTGEGWGEGERLTLLRTFQQKCPVCGMVEEVRVYSEPRGYVRPRKCARCFLKPPAETPRKRTWQ